MSEENLDQLFGDEWETEETSEFRAPIHPFDGKVKRAAYLTHERYQGGATYRMNLIVDVYKPGTTAVLKPDHEVWVSLGKGEWFSPDGGKTIESRSGTTKFSPQSAMGQVVTSVAKAGKGGDKAAQSLAKRGSLRTAATWVGVTFRFEDVDMYAGVDEKGNEKRSPKEIPLAVVSVSDSVATTNGTDAEFEAKARELALSADSFDAFKDAAMEAGLAGMNLAMFKARVLQESGVWAETRS